MDPNIRKDKKIKIATYNIFLFGDPRIITQNILAMKDQGVDVFCLQEVLKVQGKPFIGDKLMKELGDDWDVEYSLGNKDAYISHGVAILWNKRKMHTLDIKKIVLPRLTKFSLLHKLMRLAAGFKNIVPQNKALSIDFSMHGKRIRITSVHISLNGGQRLHLEQHQYIKNLLAHKPVSYEVIAGDFNTLRGRTYKEEMQSIHDFYGKDFIEPSSKIPWTQDLHYSRFEKKLLNTIIAYTKLHYRQKLDHIFTKGFIPISCERLHLEGSDHFPVVSTLVFK